MEKQFKVYGYRWFLLAVFMFLNIVIQIQWLSHAMVARPATIFFESRGVEFTPFYNIDTLAILYMLVYLVVCLPASFIIDRFNLRIGVGIGAVLSAVGALLKGCFPTSFPIIFAGQVLLSIGQPFILNAATTLVVRWFPMKERGTAVGLASLAQYLGIILAALVTPMVVGPSGEGMERVQFIYGVITAVACLLSLLTMKNAPALPPDASATVERFSFFKGMGHMFKNRDMVLVIFLFLIGLGIFNAISSMADAINAYLGIEDSDGLVAALMLVGGVIGAVILPILSDKMRKRKVFVVVCMFGMLVGVFGLTFSKYLNPYTYEWEITQKPEGSALELTDPNSGIQMISPDADGLYAFDVKVTKGGHIKEDKTVYLYAGESDPGTVAGNGVILSSRNAGTSGVPQYTFSPSSVVNGKRYATKVYIESPKTDDTVVSLIYALALLSSFVLGFFVMSAGPIGFQYAAEVTFPTPESSSQGILLLAGQITGLVFTQLMSVNQNSYLGLMMTIYAVLSIVAFVTVLFLRESPMIVTEEDKIRNAEKEA
ncbi:MAG: MFS transporter [Spirochaetia bacterium]|nr:MFS transporter [Spirochaetia bacterium]